MTDPHEGAPALSAGTKTEEGRLSQKPIARLKRWLAAHHVRLMTIKDTPHSIALGSSIGFFFGFTPLLSLKTLLSVAFAWLFRCNKIAAALSVTLHDVVLPLMPAIYLWEYRVGMWVLHGRVPQRAGFRHVPLREYMQWTTFFTLGQPLLIGSILLALPFTIVFYFIMRGVVARAQAGQTASVQPDAGVQVAP